MSQQTQSIIEEIRKAEKACNDASQSVRNLCNRNIEIENEIRARIQRSPHVNFLETFHKDWKLREEAFQKFASEFMIHMNTLEGYGSASIFARFVEQVIEDVCKDEQSRIWLLASAENVVVSPKMVRAITSPVHWLLICPRPKNQSQIEQDMCRKAFGYFPAWIQFIHNLTLSPLRSSKSLKLLQKYHQVTQESLSDLLQQLPPSSPLTFRKGVIKQQIEFCESRFNQIEDFLTGKKCELPARLGGNNEFWQAVNLYIEGTSLDPPISYFASAFNRSTFEQDGVDEFPIKKDPNDEPCDPAVAQMIKFATLQAEMRSNSQISGMMAASFLPRY